MSKITFRADDDLVERVEALDASKSEVMREALRAYLDDRGTPVADIDLIDELVADRVERVFGESDEQGRGGESERDVNVNISVEPGMGRESTRTGHTNERPETDASLREPAAPNRPSDANGRPCARCGETLSGEYVYCPNCGEKATRRLFCECGDELRSDWAYCPGCGRRTPSAEVLDG